MPFGWGEDSSSSASCSGLSSQTLPRAVRCSGFFRSVTGDPALNLGKQEEAWEIGVSEIRLPGHDGEFANPNLLQGKEANHEDRTFPFRRQD